MPTQYKLKVYPKGFGNKVYRKIELCGNATLNKLCTAILDSFNFINEHLYEFDMDNKPYSESSYQSSPEAGHKSTRIALDKLNLQKGDKFLLHYDFGDDWMFQISVLGVDQVEKVHPPRVIASTGTIEQYPDYDEEFDEEFDEGE